MSEALGMLTAVWTAPALLLATTAGFGVGWAVIGQLALLPTYASSATPAQAGRALGLTGIFVGGVFYLGQALVDDQEDVIARLVSRYLVWCLYCLAMSVGTWARLRLDLARRHRALERRAEREVEAAATAS